MTNDIEHHIASILSLPTAVIVVIPLILTNIISKIPILRNADNFKILSIVFLISGLLLLMSTIRLFYKIGKGTLAPWNPTQKLVVQGPYKYCRNPMITGVLFALLAETLWFNNYVLLFWALIFFVINTIYFIFKEEPDLEKRFGEYYVHYKKHVPRWIPKLIPYKT